MIELEDNDKKVLGKKITSSVLEIDEMLANSDAATFEKLSRVIAGLTDADIKMAGLKVERDIAEIVAAARKAKAEQATSSQGGTDHKLTQDRKRIEELESEVAKLKVELTRGRAVIDALLDQAAKGDA